MTNKAPTLIVLDLDNTLYSYDAANAVAMDHVAMVLASRLGINRGSWQEEFNWARSDVKVRLGASASSHSRLLYFKSMLEKLGVGGHFDLALQLETSYWQNFLRAMSLSSGAMQFLERCRAIGLPVVIASDLTLQVQLRKLLQLNLQTFIHGVVTSEEVGGDKPSPLFMDYIESNLGMDIARTWVIGDDLDKDRLFAQAVGANFFHLAANSGSRYSFAKLTKLLVG